MLVFAGHFVAALLAVTALSSSAVTTDSVWIGENRPRVAVCARAGVHAYGSAPACCLVTWPCHVFRPLKSVWSSTTGCVGALIIPQDLEDRASHRARRGARNVAQFTGDIMTKNPAAAVSQLDGLSKGIHRVWSLPNLDLETLWESIIVDKPIKDHLIGQAVLNFTARRRIGRTVLPLHGVILLVGAPGTGKTSLARGLASRIATVLKGSKGFRLLEVEPHALTSSAMGRTQRAVSDLFSQAIAEAATEGPTVVLLDEVETLAADRSKLSLEANPIDVHRATDAVLVQLDALAETYPELLFVATSNFPKAVDSAFTSRCDLVVHVLPPNQEACRRILAECLEGLASEFPSLKKLAHSPRLVECAEICVGLDGRAVRKAVAAALASDLHVAVDPNRLTMDLLRDSLIVTKKARVEGTQS